VGDFLFQNLDQKPEMLETLLDPIRDEMWVVWFVYLTSTR
jgi:hypothetical protein